MHCFLWHCAWAVISWCVLRAEVIRWHFAPWGRACSPGVSSLSSCLLSSFFGQYNFTLPMQDWISSVSLMQYSNFTPCPPCLCATPRSFLFPQSPAEKLQLPSCSLPLQHPPDFCLLQITKPINPHTHFLICRLALVFLSSPQTQPI